MSDVLEQMKTRRSVKKYKPDMVPQEIIDKVTEAGLYAANGMGRQATIIIQVTNSPNSIVKSVAGKKDLTHFMVRLPF